MGVCFSSYQMSLSETLYHNDIEYVKHFANY